MDVITAVKLYVNKMTNESGPGMKILLMDKETVRPVQFSPYGTVIFHLTLHHPIPKCLDQHYIDGIQPIGHVTKGGVPFRTHRHIRIKRTNETPQMHCFHSANQSKHCADVQRAEESTLWPILHL